MSAMLRRGVLSGGDTIAYAHGLSMGEYRGLPTFGHGGSWVGFRTSFMRFPEQNLSIAIFCNVSDCDPAGRARRVAEVYLGDLMEPVAETAGEPEPAAAEPGAGRPAPTAAQLGEYAGAYRSPELDSAYEIVVDAEGRLVATHWRNAPTVLAPVGPDTFAGDQWFFPQVRFVRDDAGRVTAFTVTGGARARPDLRANAGPVILCGLRVLAAWPAPLTGSAAPGCGGKGEGPLAMGADGFEPPTSCL